MIIIKPSIITLQRPIRIKTLYINYQNSRETRRARDWKQELEKRDQSHEIARRPGDLSGGTLSRDFITL